MDDGSCSIASGTSLASNFDVIVLGAGISGLVSASILAEQGHQRLLVVDEYDHVGGNHIDCTCGDYTFDVGSFIFQDDSPLLRHFPELLPLYIPIKPVFGRLNPQGVVTRYPFSVPDDLLAAGPIELSRILLSVSFARVFQREQKDARSFARYWIGARLLKRSGLEHYLERFYGVPAEQIDINFARKRMLWIKEHASVSTYIRRLMKRSATGPTNTQLVRPREGFARLYGAAKQRLEENGVTFLLAAKLERLERLEQGLQLQVGGQRFVAERVVSTIPIPRVQDLCAEQSREDLKTVRLFSLFFSFSGERGFGQSVLFNFSQAGAWKRLIMHSDFYGSTNGREYFSVEVNASQAGESVDLAGQDFRRHVAANNLFKGDLRLEGSHSLATAYPIYTEQAGERAANAIRSLRAFGVESFGRQGGFDYQPTARVSTQQAEAALGFS
ncbi:MAG: NAD(P)-binding protein [Hyphomonadaceae bacterium]|nr:NAD(P)-binding protein [Hyphomonadaceae bacterium]